MLTVISPDRYDKLRILGGMAGDDVLHAKTSSPEPSPPRASRARQPIPGVYRAALPNGRYMNLLRVMMTDHCIMDCAYCPNSIYVPRQRYAFRVDELARLFIDMAERHIVEGLFLSSGISGTPDKTSNRILKIIDAIRTTYHFKGYIHLKLMPGTSYEYVEAAHRLGSRISINIETTSEEAMRRISPHKDYAGGILAPMSWLHTLNRKTYGAAVGQATQMVVGAADETDRDIFQRVSQLYGDWDLRRVYYQAFRPARHTPLEEHPATPMWREHRLYQMDWLHRVYGFSPEEMNEAFEDDGFLPQDIDPKTMVALHRIDQFPVDVNHASREMLLRVPGIGPKAAERIVKNRMQAALRSWKDLQAMGVVRKWAEPWTAFPGHRPAPVKQGSLPLFETVDRERERKAQARPLPLAQQEMAGAAPCGVRGSCAGCALAPLHAGMTPQQVQEDV